MILIVKPHMKKESQIDQLLPPKPKDVYYDMEVTRTYLKRQKPVLTARNKFNGGVLADNNLISADCGRGMMPDYYGHESTELQDHFYDNDHLYNNKDVSYGYNPYSSVNDTNVDYGSVIYDDGQCPSDMYGSLSVYEHMVNPNLIAQDFTIYDHNRDDLFKSIDEIPESIRRTKRNNIDVANNENYEYTCEPCRKGFKRLSTLKIHVFSHIENAEIFKCPKISCNSGFKSLSIAIKHILTFHRDSKKNMIDHLKKSKYINVFRSYTALIDYYKDEICNPFEGTFCFGCFTYPRSMHNHPCSGIFYALTQCPACKAEVKGGMLEKHVFNDVCNRPGLTKKQFL